jgi:hypothetical protein
MKIAEMEKSWFGGSNVELSDDAMHNLEIMRKYIDEKKLKAIDFATDALVMQSVKNGLVFNAVHTCKVSPENIVGKAEIYKQYKTFISNIQALPQVERVYFLMKLKQRAFSYEAMLRKNVILGEFKEAKNCKMLVNACSLVFDSLKGKNRALEVVSEK